MEQSINLEREYPYTPEQVWEALTTQAAMSEWLMHGTFVGKLGAEFELFWSGSDASRGSTRGKVLVLDKPHKLAYTWDWGSNGTLVTFYLEAIPGGTKVRLEHTGFNLPKDQNVYNGTVQGWTEKLGKLQDYFKTQSPARA